MMALPQQTKLETKGRMCCNLQVATSDPRCNCDSATCCNTRDADRENRKEQRGVLQLKYDVSLMAPVTVQK
jgi:hypothetical protein